MSLFDYLRSNLTAVAWDTAAHLWLVVRAILIAVGIGIPLGIVVARIAGLRRWVLGFANVMQTIPSLALFGFLFTVPFLPGLGDNTAIVALVLYSLLPIIRNTFIGITGVDPAVVEAARGMGMTDGQLLLRVEIPLAMSVILAGVRVATVICIGLATIAAAIGASGLGSYIYRGMSMMDNGIILAGAIPAALLALLADYGLGWVEHWLKVR